MKRLLLSIASILLAAAGDSIDAQYEKDTASTIFKIYEDNDFINIYLKGTDDAYTNGTAFYLYYLKKRKPRFFVDRMMPKAGDTTVDIYSFGITQLMFTPNNIATTDYQPNDYPYSGALFATHSLYSYNPIKKFDFQTELLLGVNGPASFALQTQTFIHHVISYQEPMGWGYQSSNKILANIDFTAEKQLASVNSIIEVISGAQAFAGSMVNSFSIYPEIRIGKKMAPYFNGYISQYSNSTHKGSSKKWQAYLFVRPQAFIFLSDQLLQGKATFNNPAESVKNELPAENEAYHDISTFVYSFNYGAVLIQHHFSISFNENAETTLLKGLYSHKVGNLSLYFSW
jgi:hypothetical protein